MKLIIFLFTILFITGCKSEINSPDNNQQQPKREFTKSIERFFSNEFEKNLITAAESFYPPRDSVVNAAAMEFRIFIPDTNYWFYDAFDGVKIPYAITIHAINYFEEAIDALTASINSFIYKAEFNYKVEISYYETYIFEGFDQLTGLQFPSIAFNNVNVVEMNLSWDHYCGPECGLYIKHKRIVVFNSQGDLLQIFYDGAIPVMVS